MKMEHYIRAIAGSFVLISLLLGCVHSPVCFVITANIGSRPDEPFPWSKTP